MSFYLEVIIITESDLVKWITELETKDEMYRFYKSKPWLELRARVLHEHHYECYSCRKHGKITPAQTVHHVQHVKDYPQYALSQYITDDDGNRITNLIPLCNACHSKEHPEKQYKAYFAKKKDKDEPEERWD